MSKLVEEFTVALSPEMAESARQVAQDYGVGVDALIRTALRSYLERELGRLAPGEGEVKPVRHKKGSRSPQIDLARVAIQVKRAVEASSSWVELQFELRKDGLEIAPKGGGVVIVQSDTKDYVCKASQVGYAYSKLIKIFQGGMPGHTHTWLADRLLTEAEDDEDLIDDERRPLRGG